MRFFSFVRNRSLASKLFGGTIAALSAYVMVIGVLAYMSAEGAISGAYDQSLVVNANALLFLMQEEAEEGNLNKPLSLNISDENLTGEEKSIFDAMSEYRMFRVWYKSKLVLSTLDKLPATVPIFPQGFSDREVGDDSWRIFSLHATSKNLVIELGEQKDARIALVWNIAQDLVLPFCISLPLVALLFWRAIQTGMSDLRKVTGQVNARSPDQMTPLESSNVPADLLPLVEAINSLLDRLDKSLSRERQITELAAHELRTPLTAIKLQAQMGLRAPDEESRLLALSGLVDGVERAGHLVEQLLTLTRVEQTDFELAEVDAGEVCIRAAAELRPLSERRNQKIVVEISEPLTALANEDLLHLTITNILGNSIKYSPECSNIVIRGNRLKDKIELEIADEGPGIPEPVREKIFERFFRYHTGKVLGSGLGLTIARQCADRMQASLMLETPKNGIGLVTRLLLPKRRSALTVSRL